MQSNSYLCKKNLIVVLQMQNKPQHGKIKNYTRYVMIAVPVQIYNVLGLTTVLTVIKNGGVLCAVNSKFKRTFWIFNL